MSKHEYDTPNPQVVAQMRLVCEWAERADEQVMMTGDPLPPTPQLDAWLKDQPLSTGEKIAAVLKTKPPVDPSL